MLTMADMLDVGCVRYGKHGHEHILGSFKTSQRSGAKSVDVQMTEKKMPMIIVMMTTMKLTMTREL